MKQKNKLPLPIDKYIPEILTAVVDFPTVMVKANPGSGKTTRLPWAIANNLNKKVVVLEPRKLAAKMASSRIAFEEGLSQGKEVGYHFRFEKCTGPETQVTFYTEGTFLKLFLNNPELKNIDVVILDEFHERHLDTDIALALLRSLQERRSDLKIIIMSATLDPRMEKFFSHSKFLEIEAPIFPVEISYLPNQTSILSQSLELKVKNALRTITPADGDVLIFLPGMREMRRVQEVLEHESLILHGDLDKDEQDRALAPSENQKIILATNIAESSLTIPGVRVVIDSGIQRESHYSSWNGLKQVKDTPTTKASAIQRAGRAARTGPGKCLRLYSEQDFNARDDFPFPEIHRADLTDTYLFTTSLSIHPNWFEKPPEDKWKKAQQLLIQLGAIENEVLTQRGKRMLEIPLSSRLARIVIDAEKLNSKASNELLNYICTQIEQDPSSILKKRLAPFFKAQGTGQDWEQSILTGFLDQVGKFRNSQRDFIHYSGKTLKAHHSLKLEDEYYILFDISQRGEAIKVLPIDESWIWEIEPLPLIEEQDFEFKEKIKVLSKLRLGSIVLEETNLKQDFLSFSDETKKKFLIQVSTIFEQKKKLFSETPIFERLHFYGKKRNQDLEEILLAIKAQDFFNKFPFLHWEEINSYLEEVLKEKLQVQDLDYELPLKMRLEGKREIPIHYPLNMDPYVEAPIQDFYGVSSTPIIAQTPLTLKLLGPHKRPIQITKDLKSFWENTYIELKKTYQRDYPRHYWPDEPIKARPFLLKSHLPKV